MKKRWTILYCIIFMAFCQCSTGVNAISETQKTAISENCSAIRESLKLTQRDDTGARVYLGKKFNTILMKYITPLNVKLVEKNITDTSLLDNQQKFAEADKKFRDDFTHYMQELEGLIGIDCTAEPENFYTRLELVRGGRRLMVKDVEQLKKLVVEQVKFVTELRGKL